MNPKSFNLFLQAVSDKPVNGTGAIFGLGNLGVLELLLLSLITVVLFGGFWSLLNLSFTLMKMQKLRLLEKFHPELLQQVGLEIPESQESWWKKTYRKWTDTVPLEAEGEILLQHSYDGIMELDNNLPPWWKALFYVTIAIAPVYIYVHHFSEYSLSSTEEYEQEVVAAELRTKAYLATQSDLIDETTVTYLDDAESLLSGAAIYVSKCVACHGDLGQGGIGPNLTDDYWIHGGSIADIFKTVKYGVPEMGMIPWKNELNPAAMQEVSSYIKQMRGSNPPNPKEAQGALYEESSPVEEVGDEQVEEEPTASEGN